MCSCKTPLTADDAHHLQICRNNGRVSIHDRINSVFLSIVRNAHFPTLDDRKFRACGRAAEKKLPDGAIFGMRPDGGPIVIDTRVESPLTASNLRRAKTKSCAVALKARKDKFAEYLGRPPESSDFLYPSKCTDDLSNPLSAADISDGYGSIHFLPLAYETLGGSAPEVLYVLSSVASRMAEEHSGLSSRHLFPFYKSTLKKKLSLTLAHFVCITHCRTRDALLNRRYLNSSLPESRPVVQADSGSLTVTAAP